MNAGGTPLRTDESERDCVQSRFLNSPVLCADAQAAAALAGMDRRGTAGSRSAANLAPTIGYAGGGKREF
jgi:hypothetical protein